MTTQSPAAPAIAADLRTQLEHAQAALAGDHEGIRLWMLDCGALVAKHRDRADAAEAIAAQAATERERIPDAAQRETRKYRRRRWLSRKDSR